MIGGICAKELLRHLNYNLIRANPKIFTGYSDLTLLHHAFATKAGLRTFYGPAVVRSFGEFPKLLQFTAEHFLQVVTASEGKPVGQTPQSAEWTQELLDWRTEESKPSSFRVPQLTPNPGWKWLKPGHAEEVLTGGACLLFAR